jgi:LDH2 family malate/lactate/ureidoglycolate dehydrogenase
MTVTITFDDLLAKVAAIFRRAGISPWQAGPIARVVAAGERDGCKSHGIYRIAGILRTLKAGKVNEHARPVLIDGDAGAILRVDARGGFSNPAFELGHPALTARARKLGLAALVINDCTHFAALWPEMETIAADGLAGLALCSSYASVAPFGGTRPLFGTNPFAFAWPRRGPEPFVFDFATSVAARGEIELYRRSGRELPTGWAVDPDGQPTVDPAAALAGAMLPFGAHKGSAIGAMIELLGAVMIGDRTSTEALAELGSIALLPTHGELVIAFSLERFSAGRSGNPIDRAEVLFDAILGQGARLPSQRRFSARAKALKEGITLSEAEAAELDRFMSLGLDAVTV